MGALCCIVASRPLVTTKSPPQSGRRGIPSLSRDDDLQWRMNLSYSPAGLNTRDGFVQDMSDESPGFASPSRSRKSLEFCFQQSPRWDLSASSVNEQNTCTVITKSNSSNHQSMNEDQASNAISLSESRILAETPCKQHNHCSYPQVFGNPVSDSDNPKPNLSQEDSSTNHDSSFMKSTGDNQDSPAEEASSPNSSSNDKFLDIENTRVEPGSMTNQRCGICKKLLSQKSPWCSYKILRCGDMPTSAVFPCHHVYHVECLDKVTPTAQTRDPVCPDCSNTIGAMELPLVMPETLQLALRSLRRSHTAVESEQLSTDSQRRHIRRSQRWEKLSCCLKINLSSSSENPT